MSVYADQQLLTLYLKCKHKWMFSEKKKNDTNIDNYNAHNDNDTVLDGVTHSINILLFSVMTYWSTNTLPLSLSGYSLTLNFQLISSKQIQLLISHLKLYLPKIAALLSYLKVDQSFSTANFIPEIRTIFQRLIISYLKLYLNCTLLQDGLALGETHLSSSMIKQQPHDNTILDMTEDQLAHLENRKTEMEQALPKIKFPTTRIFLVHVQRLALLLEHIRDNSLDCPLLSLKRTLVAYLDCLAEIQNALYKEADRLYRLQPVAKIWILKNTKFMVRMRLLPIVNRLTNVLDSIEEDTLTSMTHLSWHVQSIIDISYPAVQLWRP